MLPSGLIVQTAGAACLWRLNCVWTMIMDRSGRARALFWTRHMAFISVESRSGLRRRMRCKTQAPGRFSPLPGITAPGNTASSYVRALLTRSRPENGAPFAACENLCSAFSWSRWRCHLPPLRRRRSSRQRPTPSWRHFWNRASSAASCSSSRQRPSRSTSLVDDACGTAGAEQFAVRGRIDGIGRAGHERLQLLAILTHRAGRAVERSGLTMRSPDCRA